MGSAVIGESTAETLTISETGTLKLEVGAGSITGTHAGDFNIAPDSAFAIADVGSPQDVTITCNPSGLGTRTATLAFTTNDPNQPTVSYDLKCEGLAVPVSIVESTPVSGSTIDLGSAILNTATGSQTLSISNTGTAKLEVGAAQRSGTNPGDFTISPDIAFGIEVSGSPQDVTITCTPGGLGTRTATLEFSTNDPNQPTVSYDLECEGTAPAPSLVVNTLVDENGTEADTALKCSLREAIKANNTNADFGGCANPKGTINFDPILNGNTIVLTAAPEPITENVVISGPGASDLTISGDDSHRVFEIASTNNPVVKIEKLTLTKGLATDANGGAILSASSGLLTIDSVTISNSTATGSFPNGRGGGISASTATVSTSTLSGNSAGFGGGIYTFGTATVSTSTLSGNSAGSGGGIRAFNTATVSNSTLSGNSAGFGGGIRADTATVSTSTLSGNSAGFGGGILAFNTATVSTSTLSGNSAGSTGGGIYTSSATVSTSTLSGNSAGFGGGIYTFSATVSDTTLSGNTATNGSGGGIYAGTATVSNSTLVLNRSNTGGGIRRAGSGYFVVNNTIVAGNTNFADTSPNDINGTLSGGSNNLIGDAATAGGLDNTANGNIVGVTNINTVLNTILEANSTLIQSGDPNTGTEPVLTHALIPGSQAIDAGDDSLIPSGVTTDQRGLPRIVNGNSDSTATVDIGSFEVQEVGPP